MRSRFVISFIAMIAIQIMLGGLLNLTQYLVISILPVMIICLPITFSTSRVLLVAFLTSLVVDFFTDGALGLTAVALLPVAFTRNALIRRIRFRTAFPQGRYIHPQARRRKSASGHPACHDLVFPRFRTGGLRRHPSSLLHRPANTPFSRREHGTFVLCSRGAVPEGG